MLGIRIKDAKIAIQGFSNVRYHAAKILSEWGAKIIAVSDIYRRILNVDKGFSDKF